MRIEAYRHACELPSGLPGAWNALLAADEVTHGVDCTATFEWQASLMEAFFDGPGAVVFAAFDVDDRLAGVLPVCRPVPADLLLPPGCIALLSDLYCGRSGLIVRDGSADVLRTLFLQIEREFPGWRCLQLTLPDGRDDFQRLMQAVGDRCIGATTQPVERSPYIVLPDDYDAYFRSLKPNFRTEVRRGERRLRELGNLQFRLYSAVSELGPLWDAIVDIERQSWKEAAGTSITSNPRQQEFYRVLLPRVAAAGQLLSTVLFLDDRPIAHQLCLVRGTTSAILKMSYVDDLRKHYPATVLLNAYLREIVGRGLRHLDFMGTCDDFKLRWTDRTYARTTHHLFRRNLGGRLAYLRHSAAQLLAERRGAPVQRESEVAN